MHETMHNKSEESLKKTHGLMQLRYIRKQLEKIHGTTEIKYEQSEEMHGTTQNQI